MGLMGRNNRRVRRGSRSLQTIPNMIGAVWADRASAPYELPGTVKSVLYGTYNIWDLARLNCVNGKSFSTKNRPGRVIPGR